MAEHSAVAALVGDAVSPGDKLRTGITVGIIADPGEGYIGRIEVASEPDHTASCHKFRISFIRQWQNAITWQIWHLFDNRQDLIVNENILGNVGGVAAEIGQRGCRSSRLPLHPGSGQSPTQVTVTGPPQLSVLAVTTNTSGA